MRIREYHPLPNLAISLPMRLSQTQSFLTAGDVIAIQGAILEELLDGLFYGMLFQDIKNSSFIFTFYSEQALKSYSPSLRA
jgi:hypothetical protein